MEASRKTSFNWFVTFETNSRGLLPKPLRPRETRKFKSEKEAKKFALAKFDEGIRVYAGTINPHTPKQVISSENLHLWLGISGDTSIHATAPKR